MPSGRTRAPSPISKPKAAKGLNIPQTIGTLDQSIPAELAEKKDPLDSEELLEELVATARREAIIDKQFEQDILDGVENSPVHSPKSSASSPGRHLANKPMVLVPAVPRDIKADVTLPRRKRQLRRSGTSSLVDIDDQRLKELARPIDPVLTTNEEVEMRRRFTDKLQQCAMSLDQFVRFNPKAGEEVRRSALEELVEVIEGSEQSTFLTNDHLPDIIRLVKANLFRDLPKAQKLIPFEEYDPEDVINTEWDSLNNVYKIIFRVLCHHFDDPTMLAELWNIKAMKKLVGVLLDTVIDARERRFAKIILHRTYAKVRG